MYLFYLYSILINKIIFINCYTYLSTFEAYNKNTNTLCIGDCVYMSDIQKECVYNWNGDITKCRSTSERTKRYRTITGKLCYSNCGYFENENYAWCVTKNNPNYNWDYCNRLIALNGVSTIRTNNIYITCRDSCEYRNQSYTWCHTFNNNWEYCNPDKNIILFNYRTLDNTFCATPCELYGEDPYCYDTNYMWKRCYLNPEYKYELHKIYNNFKKIHKGEYFKNGYKICNNKPIHTSLLYFDNIIINYEENNPTITLRALDSNNIITNNTNPIISYTVLPTLNYFGNPQLNLPLIIKAIITTHTLKNNKIEQYSPEINKYFNTLNPNLNNKNYDIISYIIGYKLGGPTESFNMFPQSRIYNRNNLTRLHYLESDLYTFLHNNYNRYAEFTAILVYKLNNNNILQRRPTSLLIRIRLYIDGVLTDITGKSITLSNNTLENMYFNNKPNYYCNNKFN